MHSSAEAPAVEDTLMSFFSAISDYDYQHMRDLTTEDFMLIEKGPTFSQEDFIALVRQSQDNGSTLSHESSNFETTVEGKAAWITYQNNGLMSTDDSERRFHWTESPILKKMQEGWKSCCCTPRCMKWDTIVMKSKNPNYNA